MFITTWTQGRSAYAPGYHPVLHYVCGWVLQFQLCPLNALSAGTCNLSTCPTLLFFDHIFTFWHSNAFNILFWNGKCFAWKNYKDRIAFTQLPLVLTFYRAVAHLSRLRQWHGRGLVTKPRTLFRFPQLFYFSSFLESKLGYPIVVMPHVSSCLLRSVIVTDFSVFHGLDTVEDE